MSILRFLKNWTLLVAIVAGFCAYEVYAHCPWLDFTRPYAAPTVAVVQPLLIFSMLFLSFCKIDGRDLKPCKHHLWLLLIQGLTFGGLALLLHFIPDMLGSVVVQGFMLCMICPTATSASVITRKLGGDAADITSYTVLINLSVAVIVPALVPLFHSMGTLTFWQSFMLILSKVFPMLILPLVCAQCCRAFLPRFTKVLISVPDLPFYLWAVALSLAICVTTRAITHSDDSLAELVGLAISSFLACALQFWLGRRIGLHYGQRISAAQSLGQKNTVFAIWMGYTYLNPVTSIAGGFYSIWHNVYNTWQLKQQRDEERKQG